MKKDNLNNFEKPINANKAERAYSYYSNVLKEPFDSIEQLKEAEATYYAKLKAKEDKAAQKKADATKVEDAFNELNTARKLYKESLIKLTEEYSNDLKELKTAFETHKSEIQDDLAAAETAYSTALKEFTDKYPEGYHLTLKDGDFETTISSNRTKSTDMLNRGFDLFDWIFGF
jgi:chromosome segregation ATPase